MSDLFSHAGLENDVAALNKSARTLQFKSAAEILERLHLDFVVAANVDAPKHCDHDLHGPSSR